MKFIKATCPGCGASLELADHLQSANCPNCGSQVLIEWEQHRNPVAYLELAKRFIQSKNYKEADAQLTRVLQMNPDNREVWFWKYVALKLSRWDETLTGLTGTQINPNAYVQSASDPDEYLMKAAYSKVEIAERLLQVPAQSYSERGFRRLLAEGGALKTEIASKLAETFTGEEIERIASEVSTEIPLYLRVQEHALRAKRNPVSPQAVRRARLKLLEDSISGLAVNQSIHGTGYNVKRHVERLPNWKATLLALFEILGADQPDDWVDALVLETDWRGNTKTRHVK